ncbi:hypothetical protein lbkm_0695 [Lachnospiraceae bacterium KM106-2]|nr:hypothetical protein lbkm_0695 [Lachnospiraceae bacterium KM106-2]
MISFNEVTLEYDFDSEEIEDILNCLYTLYTTKEGTVPLMRDFGLSTECVDMPIDVAQNLYSLDVIEKTEKFEPRVQVEDVDFTYGGDGQLIPHITITKGDEYDV